MLRFGFLRDIHILRGVVPHSQKVKAAQVSFSA